MLESLVKLFKKARSSFRVWWMKQEILRHLAAIEDLQDTKDACMEMQYNSQLPTDWREAYSTEYRSTSDQILRRQARITEILEEIKRERGVSDYHGTGYPG